MVTIGQGEGKCGDVGQGYKNSVMEDKFWRSIPHSTSANNTILGP